MKKFKLTKFLSSILAIVMVLSLMVPLSSAQAEESKPFKTDSQSESIIQLKAAIAEQLNLSREGPILHESLQNVSGNQDVAVIVHLSEKPVALEQGMSKVKGRRFSNSRENEVRENVQVQQEKVKKELATKKIQITQGYTFDTVLNGFAATVKARDLQKLLTVEGITLIEPDAIVYASADNTMKPSELNKEEQLETQMITSNSFLGIERLWNEGLEGRGIKVAVLDTGIDTDHPEFAGIYKGGKNFIPNSALYSKPRADDDASETLPSERPVGVPEFNENGSPFYTSHGTHVAGIIAAIGANKFGIKGVAPKVDLYAYRVLGAYGSGATSSIVKAIETAVMEKMDVINLSLGGGANSETDASSFAVNNAMIAGTIAVTATGNEGPNRGTIGTPATARLGIAVGNTTIPEAMYNGEVSITVGDYKLTKQLPLMGTTFGKNIATQLQGEFDLVAVPGYGEVKDFEGIDVAGKVALISRGNIGFVDKIANAKANGAVATIIHNFAGGTNAPDISSIFLGDSFGFLPTFDMSQTDGEAIRTALVGGTGKVSFSQFASTTTMGDEVDSSSSRGPSTPNFDIKPDVSAPGTNIMSTIPMYKKDFPDADYGEAYARKTGTSMATPHIAGIVALMKQAHPNWTPFDVKVALSNTAKVLDKTKYDVFAQGAGRVNAYAAVHPEILAYARDSAIIDGMGAVSENLKGTVTFGPQSLKDRDISVTKQVVVKDMEGNGGNYHVSVDVTKTFGDATVTVDQPTFNLMGAQILNITLTASQAMAPNGSEILGYIYIGNGETEISLPFAADLGEVAATEIKDFTITETDLSFNGDGVKDSAVLSFTLTGDVTTNYIELWDVMNPKGGEYGDGHIGYLHTGSSLEQGSYTLNISGQYKPWGAEPATTIPDGLYTIDFTGQAASGVVSSYVGPIVVKTTKPEITGSVAEGIVTGQVTDKYIDYNEKLNEYGLQYDLNDKLQASYISTVNGEVQAPVTFKLNQDGSFTFPVTDDTNAVTVIINDAAGNVGEAIIYEKEVEKPVVTLSVNPTELNLTAGDTTQLTVTETTTPAEGEAMEKDVTSEATYIVGDEKVATVVDGLVTAVGEGTTTITILYGKNEVTINVTVTASVVEVPLITLEIDQTQVETSIGEEVAVKITEVTTFGGTTTATDVTKLATYKVENEKIATVEAGVVTGKGQGNTTITVTYGEHMLTFNVVVVKPENGNGNGNNEVTEDDY